MGIFNRKKRTEGSKHFIQLKVAEIVQETPDSVSIGFELPDQIKTDFSFVAGQYVTVSANINGSEVRRSYSICSDEIDPLLKIGVKRVEGGLMSNYLADSVRVSDELQVMRPEGAFTLEKGEGAYVGIAAGSGITPVLSQIKKTARSGGTFHLFYGNRSDSSAMFSSALSELSSDRIAVDHFYTQQGDSRFTEEKISELFKADLDLLKADGFFLCGPQEMIENAKAALSTFGVPPEKVHFELFTVAAEPKKKVKKKSATGSKGICNAKIILDAEEILVDIDSNGDSVLDHLLDKGYDAPYSCKGGVCSTCKAKVLEGEATLDVNFSLSDKELEEGYILTCQAHPVTSNITVDYDQG